MKTKYGFVVLLDALGTKTDSIESSKKYLSVIADIETDMKSSHAVMQQGRHDASIFDEFSVRFFGDTLLVTYEVKNKERESEYFESLSFVLSSFICTAIKLGILFRGSVSLGEYLEEGNVVLGPAVFDAAMWYEKLEMIGIIATPKATLSLKSLFLSDDKTLDDAWNDGVFINPPLKNNIVAELFVFNWLIFLSYDDENGHEKTEKYFYKLIREFPVPLGAESKLQNTENFFQSLRKSDTWKEMPSTQAEQATKPVS
jgi:hypothetical protein